MDDEDESFSNKTRRSSILKIPKQTEVMATKRVSFASSSTIKPFVADPEKNTIWDNTYEEDIIHTDSTKSSTTNSLMVSTTSVENKENIHTPEHVKTSLENHFQIYEENSENDIHNFTSISLFDNLDEDNIEEFGKHSATKEIIETTKYCHDVENNLKLKDVSTNSISGEGDMEFTSNLSGEIIKNKNITKMTNSEDIKPMPITVNKIIAINKQITEEVIANSDKTNCSYVDMDITPIPEAAYPANKTDLLKLNAENKCPIEIEIFAQTPAKNKNLKKNITDANKTILLNESMSFTSLLPVDIKKSDTKECSLKNNSVTTISVADMELTSFNLTGIGVQQEEFKNENNNDSDMEFTSFLPSVKTKHDIDVSNSNIELTLLDGKNQEIENCNNTGKRNLNHNDKLSSSLPLPHKTKQNTKEGNTSKKKQVLVDTSRCDMKLTSLNNEMQEVQDVSIENGNSNLHKKTKQVAKKKGILKNKKVDLNTTDAMRMDMVTTTNLPCDKNKTEGIQSISETQLTSCITRSKTKAMKLGILENEHTDIHTFNSGIEIKSKSKIEKLNIQELNGPEQKLIKNKTLNKTDMSCADLELISSFTENEETATKGGILKKKCAIDNKNFNDKSTLNTKAITTNDDVNKTNCSDLEVNQDPRFVKNEETFSNFEMFTHLKKTNMSSFLLQLTPNASQTKISRNSKNFMEVSSEGSECHKENFFKRLSSNKSNVNIYQDIQHLVDVSSGNSNWSMENNSKNESDVKIDNLQMIHAAGVEYLDTTEMPVLNETDMDCSTIEGSITESEKPTRATIEKIWEGFSKVIRDYKAQEIKRYEEKEEEMKTISNQVEKIKFIKENLEQIRNLRTKTLKMKPINILQIFENAKKEYLKSCLPDNSDIITTENINQDSSQIDIDVSQSLYKRVCQMFKNSDKRWKFYEEKSKDGHYYFGALYETVPFKVHLNPITQYVSDVIVFTNIIDNASATVKYSTKIMENRLKKENLTSALGNNYNLLTLLDYVSMSMDDVLKFRQNFVELQNKYKYKINLEMDSDFQLSVEILNEPKIIWWIITFQMSLSNVGIYNSMKIHSERGTAVHVGDINDIADKTLKGPNFLKNFVEQLDNYINTFISKRRNN